MSHVNGSRQTNEWLMSHSCHIWMSHIAHMNESCRTYERVTPHIRMSRVAYERVTWHIWVTHVPRMNETCPACGWVMSHVWMLRFANRLVSSLKLQVFFAKEPYKGDDILQKRPIIWSIRESIINALGRLHEWVTSHVQEHLHTYEWVMSHVWMSHVPCVNESCPMCEWVMSHSQVTCAYVVWGGYD